MLRPDAFAAAFAGATGAFYIILFALKLVSPPFFKLFLNSQLFGADIASQIPTLSVLNFVGALIAVTVTGWIFGYLLALIYNHQTKKQK